MTASRFPTKLICAAVCIRLSITDWTIQMIDFSRSLTDNGTVVIRLGGELTGDSSEYFFGCVEEEIENGNCQIVINCSGLGYISSVGLGTLVRARSRVAGAEGRIFLACIDSRVMDVLHIVNFDRIFNIYATEEEAIAEIEKGTGVEPVT